MWGLVGATSLTAGVVGVNSCQAASIKPRNATFNDGGVPKGTRDSLEPCFSRVFQGGVNQSEATEAVLVSPLESTPVVEILWRRSARS